MRLVSWGDVVKNLSPNFVVPNNHPNTRHLALSKYKVFMHLLRNFPAICAKFTKKTLTLKVTQIPTFYMFIVEAIKKWVWTNFIPRVVNVRKSFRTLTCMCVWRNLVFHATIEKIQNQTLNEHYTTTSSACESNWQRLVRRTRKHWCVWWVRWAPRRFLSLFILRYKLELGNRETCQERPT